MEVKREAGVWNRVAAPISGGQSREELRILLINAGELLGLVQGMSGKIPKGREKIRQIQELELGNWNALKGMLVFSGLEMEIPSRVPSHAQGKQCLMRMFYLAKKAAAEYTARSVDPEFGIVYQEMAQREMRVCSVLTQLLGELFF